MVPCHSRPRDSLVTDGTSTWSPSSSRGGAHPALSHPTPSEGIAPAQPHGGSCDRQSHLEPSPGGGRAAERRPVTPAGWAEPPSLLQIHYRLFSSSRWCNSEKLFLNDALQKQGGVRLITGIFQVNADLLFLPMEPQHPEPCEHCANNLQPQNPSRRCSSWNAAASHPPLPAFPSRTRTWLQKTTPTNCNVH